MKFNVGDMVKVIPYSGLNYSLSGRRLVGQYGIIKEVYTYYVCLDIEGATPSGIYYHEIELLHPAQPPHMANQIAGAQGQSCPVVQNNMAIAKSGDNFWGIHKSSYEGWSGIVKLNLEDKKCECGSHSVSVDKHSDYCPLYIKS